MFEIVCLEILSVIGKLSASCIDNGYLSYQLFGLIFWFFYVQIVVRYLQIQIAKTS